MVLFLHCMGYIKTRLHQKLNLESNYFTKRGGDLTSNFFDSLWNHWLKWKLNHFAGGGYLWISLGFGGGSCFERRKAKRWGFQNCHKKWVNYRVYLLFFFFLLFKLFSFLYFLTWIYSSSLNLNKYCVLLQLKWI